MESIDLIIIHFIIIMTIIGGIIMFKIIKLFKWFSRGD